MYKWLLCIFTFAINKLSSCKLRSKQESLIFEGETIAHITQIITIMNHPWRVILATSFPISMIIIAMLDNWLLQNILWIGFKLIKLLHYISSLFERRQPWIQNGLITIFSTQQINKSPCRNNFISHAHFQIASLSLDRYFYF